MGSYNPGTGGDINATTLEGAFAQAVVLLESAIQAEPNADQGSISYTFNPGTGQMTGSYDLPLSFSPAAGGSITATPENTLAATFENGGGDLTATTLPAAFIELAEKVQSAELADGIGPGSGVSLSINTDTQRFTGAFSNPVSFAIGSSGDISVQATEYTT